MNDSLISALNFSFEKVVDLGHVNEAYEVGVYLVENGWLNKEDKLNWLMVHAIKNNSRRSLLVALLEKEKKKGLSSLEKGLVASLFYQLKDFKKCSEYALDYSREKPVYIDKKEGVMNVLILQTFASGAFNFHVRTRSFHLPDGHNNLMTLFDGKIKKIILRIDDLDHALRTIQQKNIDFDVIYNSITDPDRCEKALTNAIAFCDSFPDIPVINPPQSILATTRDNNYLRFQSVRNIIYPKNIKLESVTGGCHAAISEAVVKHGLQFPLIVRLSGEHSGKYMHLIDAIDSHDFADFDAVVAQGAKDIYLIEYIDVSFTDKRLPDTKLYPKFRAFLAGGKLYPAHLFIASDDFNVHRRNSDPLMKRYDWLLDMEKTYCSNPEKIIPKKLWSALEKMLKKMDLDYVGVDFAISHKEGQPGVVIFETNAAMRNGMKDQTNFMHVRKAWEKVTRRMHHVLCERAQVPAWKFYLPVE